MVKYILHDASSFWVLTDLILKEDIKLLQHFPAIIHTYFRIKQVADALGAGALGECPQARSRSGTSTPATRSEGVQRYRGANS